MKKKIIQRIAAGVAILFSLMTIVEGFQVLFGIEKPDYLVLKPLLIYNVFMGFVGILVGVIIWINHKRVITFTTLITASHLCVLIIVEVMFYNGDSIAEHSVFAMIVRSAIWLAILVSIWKIRPINKSNSNIEIKIDGEINEN
ncbi:MAG: hypothetical protein WC055_13810 [Melioribacteraceae bacterium]